MLTLTVDEALQCADEQTRMADACHVLAGEVRRLHGEMAQWKDAAQVAGFTVAALAEELRKLREQEPVYFWRQNGSQQMWLECTTCKQAREFAQMGFQVRKLFHAAVPAPAVPAEWISAMQEAHDTFQRYADLHRAKDTRDSHEKAKVNQKLANTLYALLKAAQQVPGVAVATNEALHDFAKSMLDPERNGFSVSAHVRDQARVALGMPRVETHPSRGRHDSQPR